jgi:hypothetical protein
MQPLVAKLYGPCVQQLLHRHGFGTTVLSLGAAEQMLDAQVASSPPLHEQPESVWAIMAHTAAAAAAPMSLQHAAGLPCNDAHGDRTKNPELDHCLGFIRQAHGTANKPNQQLDVLGKIGSHSPNVFQVGSQHEKICVESQWVALGLMDLVGTGALHDTNMLHHGTDQNSTTKSLLVWSHCHARMGNNGELEGLGHPSITLLLRVRDKRPSGDILSNFPHTVRHVLSTSHLGKQLGCLLSEGQRMVKQCAFTPLEGRRGCPGWHHCEFEADG